MGVRDYRQYSHDDEIHMVPGVLHPPTSPHPPDYRSDLDSALDKVARSDVSHNGGPRGKLHGR